MLIDLAMSK